MKRLVVVLVAQLVFSPFATAQNQPFKLGTFERKDTAFVGVVLRDALVIDLAAADAAVMPASSVAAPRDMKDLIARYDKGCAAGFSSSSHASTPPAPSGLPGSSTCRRSRRCRRSCIRRRC